MASKKKSSGGSKKKSGGRKYSKKAGQEVRTEMHHMRSGKHKVKNRKQAIAIGLSKARQKGAKVPKKKAAWSEPNYILLNGSSREQEELRAWASRRAASAQLVGYPLPNLAPNFPR